MTTLALLFSLFNAVRRRGGFSGLDGFLGMIQKTSTDVRRQSSENLQIGLLPDFERQRLGPCGTLNNDS
jgi:hypothetical protein